MRVSPAHTLVDHLGHRQLSIPLHIHTNFKEHGNDTRVLTDRPVPLGTHTRIDKDLRHGIPRGRVLLPLVCLVHGLHKIQWMIVGNKLQGVCNAVNKIVLTNNCHSLCP